MIHSGIDLVSISRIQKIIDRDEDSFLNRICTLNEREVLVDFKRKYDRFASYFALKEAFSKALGVGIGQDLSFQDIEVSYTDKGQPQINYLGENRKFKNINKIVRSGGLCCSLSHEGDLLIAQVIIEGDFS
jgi:holo-[acyl-carrier protein] synthase